MDPLTCSQPGVGLNFTLTDPPIYAATVAATGFRPPSLPARVMRDAGIGMNRASVRLTHGLAAVSWRPGRHVLTRFNRACRQAGIAAPYIDPSLWRADSAWGDE